MWSNYFIYNTEKFDELKGVRHKFEIEEEEKIGQIFFLFLDEFMEKGNMDLANETMGQMNEVKNSQTYLEKVKQSYPIEFKKAFEKIL